MNRLLFSLCLDNGNGVFLQSIHIKKWVDFGETLVYICQLIGLFVALCIDHH